MDKIKYLTSKEVAGLLGVTEDCIRKWDKNGKLKPDQITEGGHRRYSFNTVNSLIKEEKLTKEFIEYGREEWLKNVCKKLNGEWEEYTLKTSCDGYPVIVLSEHSIDNYPKPDDEIVLMVDKYENRSRYYLENHPNLHKGWYVTDMKHRYVNVFEKNPNYNTWTTILRNDFFGYIDDLWFYINWVFYFSEIGKDIIKEDRVTGEEFINSLINDNYTGVFSEFENLIGQMQKFYQRASKSISYETFLEKFATQLWNYVLQNRISSEWESQEDKTFRDRIRRLFKNGDYTLLLIEHNGFIYTCEKNTENTGNVLNIRIDNDEKFDFFIKSLTNYAISCKKTDYQQMIIVDDLLDNLEKPAKTEKNEKKNIKIDTLTCDKIETFDENPWRIRIKHAKCPYCDGELIAKMPTMYNPFSFKPSCVCECNKCHKEVNTDKAYPHVVLDGQNGQELNANFQ